ncbi:hypothetical protein GGR50DRAFT_598568 [Xylaria sp. CBS 124048]|nr:hypothetical protein GGR50DRAFT_598568 [Xylaria sp. CBS 124048]
MNFSQTYFNGSQPYPFMGIPPLTPSHSASDDFGRTHSPQDMYDFASHEQFPHAFDQYAQFPNQNLACPPGPQGPPTPPHIPLHGMSPKDMNAGYPLKEGHADMFSLSKPDLEGNRPAGSNSDDDDLSPAQSRRKAQNRAAQRAFRERKERHVKDLEAKLASLEAAQSETATENEKLKREMQKMSTENEILRATTNSHGRHGSAASPMADMTTGPMQYSPDDFYSHLLQNHPNKTPSHRIVESDGQRLLAAGATWDYIINHELFRRGLIDVGDVSDRLKNQVKCDGQGPVFPESAVHQAILDSVANSSDELL